jgi:hypothetical protein
MIANRTAVRMALFGVIVTATGCGNPASTTVKPNATGPAAPVTKTTQSVWEPDPNRMEQLTQTATFDQYQLSVSKEFAADAPKTAGAMKIFSWKGQGAADLPPPVLIAVIASDKKMVDEAKKNMRQALTNFSAGMTNPSGVKITKREETETGSLAGIGFSRFKWSGATTAGLPVSGLAYGGVEEPNAVMVLAINFGPNADAANKLIESAIATLKRK